MEEFNVFIVIVVLVVSILQIILFFKLWKMTNDTAEIRKTLNVMLYRNLSVEKRKEGLIDNVVKEFDKDGVVIQNDTEDNIKIRVENGVGLYKEYIQDQFKMHDLSDVYSIEELKNDIIDRYIKPKE